MVTALVLLWFSTLITPPCRPLTSEPLATLASEAVELVDACTRILAGTGQTVVPVQVTVLPHPARLAVTSVAGNAEGAVDENECLLGPCYHSATRVT